MEFVFVVPRTELFTESYPHGLCPFGGELTERGFVSIVEEHGFFVERAYAERTPSLKQIIPYTIVVREGQVLLLRRTHRGGEERLHNKLSIGVGGHINPQDLSEESRTASTPSRNPIPAATHREVVVEELDMSPMYEVHAVGLINDDSDPVGAVHVGLVQVLTVEGPVTVREVDQLEGQFASVNELSSLLEEGANFESWSSLLIPRLSHIFPECVTH